jgi:hypothetical protein
MPARQRHPVLRIVLLALGILLVVLSPVVGAIPGPGGIFVFAAGLALILPNSLWARRRFARLMRRRPKLRALVDKVMRRKSAQRRGARDRLSSAEPGRLRR